MVNVMKQTDAGWYGEPPKAESIFLEKSYHSKASLTSWTDVRRFSEKLAKEAIDMLNSWVIEVAERIVVHTFETWDLGHTKVNIKGALRNALNKLLLSILNDSSDIRKCFEDAIAQLATSLKSLAVKASSLSNDAAANALFDGYAAKIVDQRRQALLKGFVFTPHSALPCNSDSSWD